MFSIENLAWKGQTQHLFEDQKGPFGGRIMWFPPYGLTFNENTSVDWAPHSFIGRGEKIYTYVDSERRGNIDFNIIIDHPAIVNAYKDDENISDNDLLRFYAGCDIPELSKPKPEPEVYHLIKQEEDKTKKPSYKKIKFAVFYPNNYSGEESGELAKDVNYPIMYLLNGVGTGEYYNATTKQLETIPYSNGDDNWFSTYELVTDGTTNTLYPGKETKVNVKDTSKVLTGEFDGGYEMDISNNVGISQCKGSLPVRFPYKEWTSANVGVVGSDDNLKYSYNICRKTTANSGSTTEETYVLSGINTHKWKTDDGLWFYRVDKTYRTKKGGEILKTMPNYADLKSHGLNSVLGLDKVRGTFSNDEDTTYVSLADMAEALMPKHTLHMKEKYFDAGNVAIISEIIHNHKIRRIDVDGYASKQGYTSKNERGLSKRRSQTVAKWLEEWLNGKLDASETHADAISIEPETIKGTEQNDRGTNDNQASVIKLDKCAVATISYQDIAEYEAEVAAASAEEAITKTVGEDGEFLTRKTCNNGLKKTGIR